VVLGLAAGLEGHADNVAACLSGGLTIAWTAGPARDQVRRARLFPLPGLKAVLCVPAAPVVTEAARAVLPEVVPHADAAANAARAALLISALTARDSGALPGQALFDATEDFLHQRYRASAMPETAQLLAALRAAGVPAVVSGAGPAVLALIVPGAAASPDEVAAIAAATGPAWTVLVLDVDRLGATVAP
jgi:homoserine kinase